MIDYVLLIIIIYLVLKLYFKDKDGKWLIHLPNWGEWYTKWNSREKFDDDWRG